MSDLEKLQKKVIAFRDARDWKQFHNPKDLTLSLVLEVSELLEHFQWKNTDEFQKHLASSRQEVSDEIADIFNYLLLISYELEIDLADALRQKLAKNDAKYPVEKAKGNHKKYTELEKE